MWDFQEEELFPFTNACVVGVSKRTVECTSTGWAPHHPALARLSGESAFIIASTTSDQFIVNYFIGNVPLWIDLNGLKLLRGRVNGFIRLVFVARVPVSELTLCQDFGVRAPERLFFRFFGLTIYFCSVVCGTVEISFRANFEFTLD